MAQGPAWSAKGKLAPALDILKTRWIARPPASVPLVEGAALRMLIKRFIADIRHGVIEPGRLQIAIVPLVEIARQAAGLLAKDTHDRFASQAGFRVQNALLPMDLVTRQHRGLKFLVAGVRARLLQLQDEPDSVGR